MHRAKSYREIRHEGDVTLVAMSSSCQAVQKIQKKLHYFDVPFDSSFFTLLLVNAQFRLTSKDLE